ncbi:Melanopsin [Gaertneriomyces sp. JEL0708]|nr:Melanopsin [Gaertneriomyces sp. JEL0708]
MTMDLSEARFLDIETVRYSTQQRLVIAVFFLVNLGGTIGNGFMLYLFSADKKLWAPATFLVANLALIDFGLGFLNAFFVFGPNLFTGRYYFGFPGGQLNGYVEVMFCAASLFNLGFLGLDRWLVIVRNYRITTRDALMLSLGCWIWGILLASIPYWFGNLHVLEASQLYFAGDWSSRTPGGLVMTLGCLFTVSMPLLWFSFSYTQILRVIKKNNREWNSLSKTKGGAVADRAKMQELKAAQLEAALAKRSAIVVGVFVANWLIYDINFLVELGTGRQLSPVLDALAMLGGHFNSFMNPILFIVLDPRFWAAALRVLKLERFGSKGSQDTGKTSESGGDTASPRASAMGTGTERKVSISNTSTSLDTSSFHGASRKDISRGSTPHTGRKVVAMRSTTVEETVDDDDMA